MYFNPNQIRGGVTFYFLLFFLSFSFSFDCAEISLYGNVLASKNISLHIIASVIRFHQRTF